MPIFQLDDSLLFPPAHLAEEDGFLAVGGDLSPTRIYLAYQQGIFPWFNDDGDIRWYSPDPRFVLFPEKIKLSKSMKTFLKNDAYHFRINYDFEQVIHHCKNVNRQHQPGTWITDGMEAAYIELHHQGIAHSAECWYQDKLVGGLYGILLKRVFCGESMFSLMPNCSKMAFIHYVQHLLKENIELIDCQMHTPHLESLGGEMIPREVYMRYLMLP